MPTYTRMLVSLAPHLAQILWYPKDTVDDEICTSTADVQLLSYICVNNPSILLNHCIISSKIFHHSCRQYVPTKYPYAHFIWTHTLLIRLQPHYKKYFTIKARLKLYLWCLREYDASRVPQKSVSQRFCKCETEVIKHTVYIKNPIVGNLLVFISTTFFCRF
jgi:hypothetical protein